ncbi:PemK family transcriptional regulator, partial [Enterococcus faecalis]
SDETGIEKDSGILVGQIRTIDKGRLKEKVCHLRLDIMEEVDRALGISVGLSSDSAPAKANSAT